MSDVHPGQYLNEGTELTTLQGVDDALHVDFTVPQAVAAGLARATTSRSTLAPRRSRSRPRSLALDARVDPTTRNARCARASTSRRRPVP